MKPILETFSLRAMFASTVVGAQASLLRPKIQAKNDHCSLSGGGAGNRPLLHVFGKSNGRALFAMTRVLVQIDFNQLPAGG